MIFGELSNLSELQFSYLPNRGMTTVGSRGSGLQAGIKHSLNLYDPSPLLAFLLAPFFSASPKFALEKLTNWLTL